MAYIGQGIKEGTFSVLDTSGNTYDGSNTTFSLGTQVGSPAQLYISSGISGTAGHGARCRFNDASARLAFSAEL